MKVDTSRLKKGTSEVPPECQQLIDRLRQCTHDELFVELSKIETWTYGKCELYHWIDILDIFDTILEQATEIKDSNDWCLACDIAFDEKGIKLLLLVLNFTTLLIEHSFSRHLYNSVEHLTRLLWSSNMEIVLGVLNLLYMFSKRSNFISRLNSLKKNSLLTRLNHIAESWGGKEYGFALANCCREDVVLPTFASTFFYEYYNQDGTLDSIEIPDLDKCTEHPAQIAKSICEKINDLDEDQKMHIFTRIRLSVSFHKYPARLQFVQARLQALSVLVYSNSLQENIHTLLYPGFLEELVELLEMKELHLVEIRAAALRTLTSIIHLDRNPHFPKKPGSRLVMIIDVTGAASYHGFLPTLVRTCIQNLTTASSITGTGTGTGDMNLFPLPLATALFSFLYHLASYELGGDALVACGMMESLLKVINWPGTELEHITFVTRAVRVIDLITNIEMQSFQNHGGLNSFIGRLDLEVNICRREQPFEIEPQHDQQALVNNMSIRGDVRDDSFLVSDDTNMSTDDVHPSTSSSQSSSSYSSTAVKVSTPNMSNSLSFEQNSCNSSSSKTSKMNAKTCLPQRAALLKSMLNFLKKAIQDPSFSESIRHVMEGTLPNSLRHIISNAEYYGPSLFLLATDVVTVYVFQEPGLLSSLQDNGLTDVVLQALLKKDVPATREVLGSLPNVFSALCLNARGLDAFVKYNPFDRLFKVLLSPVYLLAMRRRRSSDPMGDTATNLGNAMDELMRHQPSLRSEATKAIIKLLEELVILGTDPKYICWRATNKNDNTTQSTSTALSSSSSSALPQNHHHHQQNLNCNTVINDTAANGNSSSDEEDDDEEEASTSSHHNHHNHNHNQSRSDNDNNSTMNEQQTSDNPNDNDNPNNRNNETNERTPLPLIDYILNVMKFVDAILSNNSTDDHCREFVIQGGLKPLLSILALPNLPVDSPITASAQAVAAVCKSILNLAHEPQVLQVGLQQLSIVVDQLKPLQTHNATSVSSVLLHELANCPNIYAAFSNATYTPLLHAMSAVHGYIVMLVHVCRTGQPDIRTLLLNKWAQNTPYGKKLLKNLVDLYTSLVWESTLLLALCTEDIFPAGCEFGKEDIEKLPSDCPDDNINSADAIILNCVKTMKTTVPGATTATTATTSTQAGNSNSMDLDINSDIIKLQNDEQQPQNVTINTTNVNNPTTSTTSSASNNGGGGKKIMATSGQLRYIKALLGASSRLGRALAELFGNLVKLCVGSPIRQRRGHNFPPTPVFTSTEARDIARVLSYVLVDGFSHQKLLPSPVLKLKFTFFICSVGFTGPMLFDEKRYAFHLILHNFVEEGGLTAFFDMFRWVITAGEIISVKTAIANKNFADGTGEFLDAWLMLLEKMVNTKAILESPHIISTRAVRSKSEFDATSYLITIHRMAFNTVTQLWGMKPLPTYGVRMTESIMSILKHILKSDTLLKEKYKKRMSTTDTTTAAGGGTAAATTSNNTNNPLRINQEHLRHLLDMGFSRDHVLHALLRSFSMEQATDYLLSQCPPPPPATTTTTTTTVAATTPSTTTVSPQLPIVITQTTNQSQNDIDISDMIMETTNSDTTPAATPSFLMQQQLQQLNEETQPQDDDNQLELDNDPVSLATLTSLELLSVKYKRKIEPLSDKIINMFSKTALSKCLYLMDQLPETVNKGVELLAIIYERNSSFWKYEFLKELIEQLKLVMDKVMKGMDESHMDKERYDDVFYGETANKFYVRLLVCCLFCDEIYSDIRIEIAHRLKGLDCEFDLIQLISDYLTFMQNNSTASLIDISKTPKWLSQIITLLDLLEKVSVYTQRKYDMHNVTTRIWKWYDVASGKWNAYSVANNRTINDAYWSGETSVRVSCGRQRYAINFNCMSQVNEETGNHRPVILALKATENVVQPAAATVAPTVTVQPTVQPPPPQNDDTLSLTTSDESENEVNPISTTTVPTPTPTITPSNNDYDSSFYLQGLDIYQTKDIVANLVKLISTDTSVSRDALHAIMKFLVRLTKSYDNAKIFAKEGGVRLLLNMKQSNGYIGFPTLSILLIRHVLEEPKTLELAMERVIANRTIQSIPPGYRDLVFLLRQMSSAISRDPDTFEKIAKTVLRVDISVLKRNSLNDDNRLLLKSLPSPPKRNDVMEESVSIEVVHDLLNALIVPCQQHPHLFTNNTTNDVTMNSVDQQPQQQQQQRNSNISDNFERLQVETRILFQRNANEPVNNYDNNVITDDTAAATTTVRSNTVNDNKDQQCCGWHIPCQQREHDKLLLPKGTILKFLADAVRSYQTLAPLITNYVYKAGSSPLIQDDTNALSFILDKLLTTSDTTTINREISSMCRVLIAALSSCSEQTSVQYQVVSEVKAAINRALALPESSDKHSQLQILVGLIPTMIENCPSENSKTTLQPKRNDIFYIMVRKGLISDLAKLTQYLDLSSPHTIVTINAVLKPLEALLRMTNQPGPVPLTSKNKRTQSNQNGVGNAAATTAATAAAAAASSSSLNVAVSSNSVIPPTSSSSDVNLLSSNESILNIPTSSSSSLLLSAAGDNDIDTSSTRRLSITDDPQRHHHHHHHIHHHHHGGSTGPRSSSDNNVTAQDEQLIDDQDQSEIMSNTLRLQRIRDSIHDIDDIMEELLERAVNIDNDRRGRQLGGRSNDETRDDNLGNLANLDTFHVAADIALETSSESGDSDSNGSENDEREIDDDDENEEEAEDRSEIDIDEGTRQYIEIYDRVYERRLSPSIPELERDTDDILMIRYPGVGNNDQNDHQEASGGGGVGGSGSGGTNSILVHVNYPIFEPVSGSNNVASGSSLLAPRYTSSSNITGTTSSSSGGGGAGTVGGGSSSGIGGNTSTTGGNDSAMDDTLPGIGSVVVGGSSVSRMSSNIDNIDNGNGSLQVDNMSNSSQLPSAAVLSQLSVNHRLFVPRVMRTQNQNSSSDTNNVRQRHYQFLNLNSRNTPVILQRLLGPTGGGGGGGGGGNSSITNSNSSTNGNQNGGNANGQNNDNNQTSNINVSNGTTNVFRDAARVILMDNIFGGSTDEGSIDLVDQSGYLFGRSLAATLSSTPTALHWWLEEAKALGLESQSDICLTVANNLIPELEAHKEVELARVRSKRKKKPNDVAATDGDNRTKTDQTTSSTTTTTTITTSSSSTTTTATGASNVVNPTSSGQTNSEEDNKENNQNDDEQMETRDTEIEQSHDDVARVFVLENDRSELANEQDDDNEINEEEDDDEDDDDDDDDEDDEDDEDVANNSSEQESSEIGEEPVIFDRANRDYQQPQQQHQHQHQREEEEDEDDDDDDDDEDDDDDVQQNRPSNQNNESNVATATATTQPTTAAETIADNESEEIDVEELPYSIVMGSTSISLLPPPPPTHQSSMTAAVLIPLPIDDEEEDFNDILQILDRTANLTSTPIPNASDTQNVTTDTGNNDSRESVANTQNRTNETQEQQQQQQVVDEEEEDDEDDDDDEEDDDEEEGAVGGVVSQSSSNMNDIFVFPPPRPGNECNDVPPLDPTEEIVEDSQEPPNSSYTVDGVVQSNTNETNQVTQPQTNETDHVRSVLGDLEVPEGVDPSFLAALPHDMREEVIAEHLRLQRIRQRAQQNAVQFEHASVAEVNPEFLAALPPNIQEEVLAQQRIEQQRQAAATANPNDPVDAAAFFQNLQPSLRQAILTDMEDSQISVLPPDLAAEAQNLRRDWENRNRMLMHERLLNQIGNSANISSVLRYRRGGFRYPGANMMRPRWTRLNTSSSSGESSSPSLMTLMERQGRPILDHEALTSLLILLFIDEPKFNTSRLHRVIRHLCCHVPTREWIIKSLLSIIESSNLHSNTTATSNSTTSPLTISTRPQWLNIRLDAALGSRANVFVIKKAIGTNHNPTDQSRIADDYIVSIHPQASQTVCKHTIDLLITLAKTFPKNFLPCKKLNSQTTSTTPAEPSSSGVAAATGDVTTTTDPSSSSSASSASSTSSSQTTVINNKLVNNRPSSCNDKPGPSTFCNNTQNRNSTDFWDIIIRLDCSAPQRKIQGPVVASAASASATQQQKSNSNTTTASTSTTSTTQTDLVTNSNKEHTTFSESPFGQLISMLSYDIVKKSCQLTDKLLRLLSFISVALPDEKLYGNKMTTNDTTTASSSGNANASGSGNNATGSGGATSASATGGSNTSRLHPGHVYNRILNTKRIHFEAPKDNDVLVNESLLPNSEEQLLLAIEVLTSKSCSEEGLEDATSLLLNMSQCSNQTRTVILNLLIRGAKDLALMVKKQITNLMIELKEINCKQKTTNFPTTPSSADTSPDEQHNLINLPSTSATSSTTIVLNNCGTKPKGILQDRFTNQTVIITAPAKVKQTCELQLTSMIPLISKTSSQAFFLRILKVIIQIRESVRTAMSKDENKTHIILGPTELSPLSETLDLDDLWNTLSDCLLELEETADNHAVLVLQPAVEAFFLVHASQQNKTANQQRAANKRDNQQNSQRQNQINDAANSSSGSSNQQQQVNDNQNNLQISISNTQSTTTTAAAANEEYEDSDAASTVTAPDAIVSHDNDDDEQLEGATATIPPSVSVSGKLHLDNKDQNEEKSLQSNVSKESLNADQRKFLQFAEKHRTVLNQILRQTTTHLSDGPFAVLVDHTRILDFDVKRRYFRTELDRLDEGIRREELAIHVHRVTVFEDSFRELYRRNPEEWKNRFYIVFEDEEGQDAGGLLREWYVIISREIFNPMYALFTVSPGDRVTYMINPSSHANPNHLCYYKFVGRVIAKAIYDNKLLECYFTRSFYKHILGIQVKYTDMESEDYGFYKGLVFLLENHISELGYELTFSLEVQEFGVTEVRDLIPNGRNIPVTEENKLEYIHLVCQLKMSGSIRQQLNAFLDGFYDIIPKRLISIFNEQELELLISGLPNVDVEDLKANTEYHKYQANSIQIQWFWRALRSFDQADRAKFLQFVTGTSKVPLQGFGALEGMNGIQKFQIHREDRSTDRLPSAHTCFNQLDLPVYKTYDKLRSSLLKAIHECSEGFGFA